VTAFRFEGFAPSIAARVPVLEAALAGYKVEDLADGLSFWAALRDVSTLAGASQLWRIILPAREMPRLAEVLDAKRAPWLADWAGGLIWAGWESEPQPLRDAVSASGGSASLIRADAQTRARVPAFHPLPPLLGALEARVRRAFDPAGVFENGRFGDQLDAN
jgi:glycolate oxidase FAD binding subunit